MRSSELLMAIVNDILDVSKIEAGAVELEAVAFDIAQLIEEVASAHAATALQRGLELIADVDANLPKQVVGDPLRVRQVVTNLVSNAIKFTPKGEVVVGVRLLEAQDGGRVRLRLAVTDTGIGVAPDKLASIFNPFSQADSSTTREFGGTGLGLSICRQLVELMGSTLEVSSAPGRGSSFSFELVLDQEDLLTTRGLKVNSRLWRSRVLVVDASERMRLTLQSQLGAWGVETFIASSPDEAAQAARQRAARGDPPFDVAIVDAMTLGQPVVTAAQQLGAVLAPLGCVMIAMGSSLGALRQQLQACGFATDLAKPIHRNRLLDALNIALDAEPIAPTVGEEASPRPRHLTEGARDVASNGHKVLVVEDNATNQRVAVAQLRALGYAHELAADGRSAVALLANPDHGYRCVLMDGQMPIMDGYAATRAVRAREDREGRERVPILALTADAMPGDRERATEAGMDGYLAKPFTLSQLEAALSVCLAGPRFGVLSPAMKQAHSADWRETLDAEIVGQLQMLESASPGFLEQVVHTYLATSDENLRDLVAAVEGGDLLAAQRRAHALVGSSRQVGAMQVGSLCASMEHASSLAGVSGGLDELRGAMARAQGALRAVIPTRG
jgi:CheY-like chemotaxis protein/anti-sigma regulatory factor (Ser/Thr protein kinase)